MSQTNANRDKSARLARLSFAEAAERLPRDKDNKQQRRKKRYDWP